MASSIKSVKTTKRLGKKNEKIFINKNVWADQPHQANYWTSDNIFSPKHGFKKTPKMYEMLQYSSGRYRFDYDGNVGSLNWNNVEPPEKKSVLYQPLTNGEQISINPKGKVQRPDLKEKDIIELKKYLEEEFQVTTKERQVKKNIQERAEAVRKKKEEESDIVKPKKSSAKENNNNNKLILEKPSSEKSSKRKTSADIKEKPIISIETLNKKEAVSKSSEGTKKQKSKLKRVRIVTDTSPKAKEKVMKTKEPEKKKIKKKNKKSTMKSKNELTESLHDFMLRLRAYENQRKIFVSKPFTGGDNPKLVKLPPLVPHNKHTLRKNEA